MNTGELIIIALRLLVPLAIFRWPLWGGVAALLLDGADVILIELIPGGSFGAHYHFLDKVLDTYYLTIELIVALRWRNRWATWPAVALFAYRLVGVALFELTQRRIMLFIFPNLFENWWLYVVAVRQSRPRWEPHSPASAAVPMLILLVPKMAQEYLLHFAEAQPWNWFKQKVGLN